MPWLQYQLMLSSRIHFHAVFRNYLQGCQGGLDLSLFNPARLMVPDAFASSGTSTESSALKVDRISALEDG